MRGVCLTIAHLFHTRFDSGTGHERNNMTDKSKPWLAAKLDKEAEIRADERKRIIALAREMANDRHWKNTLDTYTLTEFANELEAETCE